MKFRHARSVFAALLLTTAVAPATAVTASAANSGHLFFNPKHVVATDPGKPDSSTPIQGQPAPLGTTATDAEGVARKATHRVYVTYDLTSLAGPDATIHNAVIELPQGPAANCRTTDVTFSVVAPTGPITWASPPKVVRTLERLTDSSTCGDGATWTVDIASALREALARHERSVTFEVRVTAAKELSPTFGRYLGGYLSGSVDFTSKPFVLDGSTSVAGASCADSAQRWVGPGSVMAAIVGGSDRTKTAEIRYWREGAAVPEPVVLEAWGEWARPVSAQLPYDGSVTDGNYLWQARAVSTTEASDWTAPCSFTVDATAPAVSPVVTVLNEADLLAGRPVKLQFASGGVEDVVCYQWTFNGVFSVPVNGQGPCDQDQAVRPAELGGPATAEIATTQAGPLSLDVRSVDRAGNYSPIVDARVWIPDSSPTLNPAEAVGPAGVPITITATAHPAMGPTKEFRVTVGSEPQQTLVATDNKATFHVTPVADDWIMVRVVSVAVDGTVSAEAMTFAYTPWE